MKLDINTLKKAAPSKFQVPNISLWYSGKSSREEIRIRYYFASQAIAEQCEAELSKVWDNSERTQNFLITSYPLALEENKIGEITNILGLKDITSVVKDIHSHYSFLIRV